MTSGTFSPTLGTGIALGLLHRSVTVGATVEVLVRNRAEPFAVVRLPFVEPGVREAVLASSPAAPPHRAGRPAAARGSRRA